MGGSLSKSGRWARKSGWFSAYLLVGVLPFSGADADAIAPLTAQPAPAIAPSQTSAVTDRDYLLAIITERDRLYSARFDAQEKASQLTIQSNREAVDKAAANNDKRFDSVNEFRNTLKDQQTQFLQRSEYNAGHKQLIDDLGVLRTHVVPRDEHENRWKAQDHQFKEIGEKLEKIAERQFAAAGAQEGQAWLWGVLVGALGLVIATGTLLMNFANRRHGAVGPV